MAKRKGLGLFNMNGSREKKKVLNHPLHPFGAYDFMSELLDNTDFKYIKLLGERFSIPKEKEQVKIYLHRFFEMVKFDYTKQTRPPLILRYHMESKWIEVIFDTEAELFGMSEQEYIEQLKKDLSDEKKRVKDVADRLYFDKIINLDQFHELIGTQKKDG